MNVSDVSLYSGILPTARGSANYDPLKDINTDDALNVADVLRFSGQIPRLCYHYTYHEDGQLAKRTGPAGETVYIGGVSEKKTGSTTTHYYEAAGRRIAMRRGTTVYYLANDHLGGTAVVMDAAGNMVSRTRYYPYGMTWTQEGTSPTDKLFTGQQRETAQMYYFGARFYSADLGRFLQPDAVVPGAGDPQALNRYSYVLNNPTTYTDPTGNYPIGIECDRGCPMHAEHPGFESWAIANHPEWISCDNIFGGCSADFPDWTGDAGRALERKWTIEPLMDWRNFTPIGSVQARAQEARAAALAAVALGVAALDLAGDIDLPDTPCINPFGCGSGSSSLSAQTDNNGNPLPEGATKLKKGQGYRLPDGTRYLPLRKGESGHHGETGHQINRQGQYRNVGVNGAGKIVPVPGNAGQWHRP